jgi:hypothetical protein
MHGMREATPLRSKYEKFWERNMGVALSITARGQLSGNYEMHMKYSRIYLYCQERLEKARYAHPKSQNQ